MKNKFLLLLSLITPAAFAAGKIINSDVKSLAEIQSAVLTTTGNLTSGNACIASPGSTAGLAVGIYIYDSTTPGNVLTGTTVAGLPGTCSAGQIQMSQNAAGTATGDTLKFGGTTSQLINDTKIYVTGLGLNKQLSAAIAAGDLAGTANAQQSLLNGGFDYWQEGATTTVANTVRKYVADQWYVKNSLGTSGVITGKRVTGVQNGSTYGLEVKITTAPTASQANGTELYQPLGNLASMRLYNQTASLSVYVKATGNVNQVGLQFYYATSEVALTTSVGAEATCTVNSSTFTLCKLEGIALGTSMTTAGIVGVRVRTTGVSTGNTYDLNNGYVVEQAMLNKGATAGTFVRYGSGPAQELAELQAFYEKSWNISVFPGTNDGIGAIQTPITVINGNGYFWITFKVTKRIVPVVSFWTTVGASGQIASVSSVNVGTARTPQDNGTAQTGMSVIALGSGTDVLAQAHWVADARI